MKLRGPFLSSKRIPRGQFIYSRSLGAKNASKIRRARARSLPFSQLSPRLGRGVAKRLRVYGSRRSGLLTPGGSTDLQRREEPQAQGATRGGSPQRQGRAASLRPRSRRVVAAAPGWGGVISRASRGPGSRAQLGESFPSARLSPGSPRARPLPESPSKRSAGSHLRARVQLRELRGRLGGGALPQTKARPLAGPIKPPAFQPSLFPGSPINPGAPRPAAPVPQGLLNASEPGTRGPRRPNASVRRRVWRARLGVMGTEGSLGLWGDPVRRRGALCFGLGGLRGNCACQCETVTDSHGSLETGGVAVRAP